MRIEGVWIGAEQAQVEIERDEEPWCQHPEWEQLPDARVQAILPGPMSGNVVQVKEIVVGPPEVEHLVIKDGEPGGERQPGRQVGEDLESSLCWGSLCIALVTGRSSG